MPTKPIKKPAVRKLRQQKQRSTVGKPIFMTFEMSNTTEIFFEIIEIIRSEKRTA